MTTLAVVLLIGATARLTRLLTVDFILEPVREFISRGGETLGYFIRCDWCVSVWTGLVVFLFGWYAPDTLVLIVTGGFTASLVAGWLGHLEAFLESKEPDFE